MAVMMNPREKWTDGRLDDLNAKVDRGFADLKTEMSEGFKQVDQRFQQVDRRFDRMEDRFDALNRTLIGGFFVMIATLVGVIAAPAGIALF